MSEPRLLIVTHYFPLHGGGVERVAGELARVLAAQFNAKIVWVASDCDPPPESTPNMICQPAMAWNGIERIVGVPYPLWTPATYLRLWKRVGEASVVHVHDYLYAGNLVAAVMSAMRGKPLLVTQHIGFVPYTNPLMRWLLSGLNHSIGAMILRQARQVVFISDTVRDYFSAFVTFARPPRLIANGLDTALFKPAAADERQRQRAALGIEGEQPLLLFVGRFVEKKGLLILKELAREFAYCRWVFAGQGPLDPGAWGFPNVRVMHGLSQVELVPLYQAADLLVLPSKGEGFPLVVQESMACGTPAMAGLESAVALPGLSTLIFSADAESGKAVACWKSRLQQVLENRQGLTDLRRQVVEFAQREWSWRKCSAEYATLIVS